MKENLKRYLKNSTIQESIFFMCIAAALISYALINHYEVELSWSMSPYLFPALIAVFLILLSVSLFFDGVQQMKEAVDDSKKADKAGVFKILTVTLLSVGYYIFLPVFTFVPSTIVFLLVLMIFLGERRWYVYIPVSVVTAFAIYIVFGRMLHVMLP